MTAIRLNPILPLIPLSAAVFVLGAWTVREEAATYFQGGATSVQRVAASLELESVPGLSIATRQATLLDCDAVLRAPEALELRFLPEHVRIDMVSHCRAVADAIAASAPTTSLAWLVGARASSQLGDWSGFNDRLLRSQLTGPTEQWIAELRVGLSEDNHDRLDERTRASSERDLRMLIGSLSGIYALTQRYLDDPTFRERITAIVESMPEASQNRFLSVLRRQIR